MKTLFCSVLAIMALAMVPAANATTISSPCTVVTGGNSSIVTCDYFDSSLGILTGATLSLDSALISFSDTITATGGTLNYSLTGLSGTLYFDTTSIPAIKSSLGMPDDYTGIAMTPADFSGTLAGGAYTTISSNSGIVSTSYSATSYSPFEGTGTFSFTVTSTISGSSSFDNSSSENRVYGLTDVWTITYDYAEVPEPSTIGMALGGFGFLLLGWHRRRTAR